MAAKIARMARSYTNPSFRLVPDADPRQPGRAPAGTIVSSSQFLPYCRARAFPRRRADL